jgi:Ca2+-binding RTX toxin-like protein
MNGGQLGGYEYAVYFDSGDDHFVNRGRITGLIALFDGDDTADLRKGKLIDSEVQGGDGDDVYIVDKANISISEANGHGYDTVKTTVSFTLDNDGAGNDEIEVLQAIGKTNLNLTGNNGDNILNGNSSNNKLFGGDGIDILWGHGGNDIMTGGVDVDLFYFAAKSGVDKILDFTINEDEIRLVKIAGIDDFDDLESRMKMVDTDGDGETDDATVINLGHGNRITLVGIDKDDLGGGDFDIL